MADVKTALALWGDRHLPPSAIADQARALQAAGVDGMLLADQFGNFIPPQLWREDYAPAAALLADPDSHSDVFALAGYLLAAAPNLDITLSTDSVRRAPAELLQAMLTLANMTSGQATVQVGGGEAKQCAPFGYKRSQGMSRMKDLFQLWRALLESDGKPIDFEGPRYTFERASIGGGMPNRPKIMGLGGGPTLIDHATSYADGLATTCPPVYAGPEAFAAAREQIREQLVEKGRDPDRFEFAVWFPCLVATDRDQLEGQLENPLIKWLGAVFGRIETPDWEKLGLEQPFPEGWRYYKDLLPQSTPDALVEEVLAKVTRDHVLSGWVCGTPEEVAATISEYVAAGADWVCPVDYLPMVLEPAQAEPGFARSLKVTQLIKGAQPVAAPAHA